jgi:UPF0716 protein FxsA
MFALIALLFIVLPLVEIYVIVQVGHAIGALDTIGLLLLLSICGAWLAKHEGFLVLTRLRDQLNAGRMPTNELVDGVLILAGGLLLLTPGFVTDAFGLLFLFPPTRAGARVLLKRRFRFQVYGLPGGRRPGGPPDDDVIDV